MGTALVIGEPEREAETVAVVLAEKPGSGLAPADARGWRGAGPGWSLRGQGPLDDTCQEGQGEHEQPDAPQNGAARPLHGRRTTPERP